MEYLVDIFFYQIVFERVQHLLLLALPATEKSNQQQQQQQQQRGPHDALEPLPHATAYCWSTILVPDESLS